MKYIPAILILSVLLASCSSPETDKKHNADEIGVATAETDHIAEVTVMDLQPTVFNHEIVSNGRDRKSVV